MTTDTGLPGEAAEPIDPAQLSETQVAETATADPAGAEVAATDPAGPDVAGTEPTGTDATATDPAGADVTTIEPTGTDAVPTDPAGSDVAATDPALIEAEAAQRAQAAARRSRRRRNAVRWVGAVVVTLAVGGGTAYALTLPQRTDMPGLGTSSDGRYAFPQLSLPALPAGQPAPGSPANADSGQHLSDIRKLLLPKPTGATTQAVKNAVDGWLADPSPLFIDQDGKRIFSEYGLRHSAVESWNATDGASTTIYLLQFADYMAASTARSALADGNVTADDGAALSEAATGVPSNTTARDLSLLSSGVSGEYSTVKGGGKIAEYGTFVSGDTIAVVIQSGPASLQFAPFQQVMTLQAEMLQ